MSLRQEFFDGIEEIFSELDDLIFCMQYTRYQDSAYIPGGRVSAHTKPLNIRALEDTSTQEINGVSVSKFDKVYLIPAVDLCDLPPSTNDSIKTADGTVYTVNQHSTDPSKTSYLVGVKK